MDGGFGREVLIARLAAFPRRSLIAAGLRPAAVAIVVVEDADGYAILLTVRAGHLATHRGQFALPGGRLEPGEDPTHAALRELDEELGLRLGPEAALGHLDDFATRSGYLITPVVVWAGPSPALVPDPDEVAEVHHVRTTALDAPGTPRFLPTEDPGRPLIEYPLLDTEVYAPTAALLYQFREVALHGRATRVAHLEQPRFAWQ